LAAIAASHLTIFYDFFYNEGKKNPYVPTSVICQPQLIIIYK